MLKVLTLASLFPDSSRPTLGPFVERQTLGLAAHADVDLRVVSPRGLPPFPLSRHQYYRALADLPEQEAWKGVTVYRPRFTHWPATGGRFDAGSMARAVLPLLQSIRHEFPFELIDAEFFFPDGPAAVWLGERLGVPVSIKARGADIHYWGTKSGTGPQVVAAGQKAQGLLAVAQSLKTDMAAIGMPEERIRVHYTGVDLERFTPGNRQALKTERGMIGPLIACVGALIPRKRQALVIAALERVPGANLVLIGKGEDELMLRDAARQAGLEQRVHFTGAIPQTEIAGWLAAADIMCLPSASEGLANAWVEALACGTPVVITDVGGARELIDRPEAGRLVPADPAFIAEAISAILANPPAQQDVRAAAMRFTWEANRDALYAHLSALVS